MDSFVTAFVQTYNASLGSLQDLATTEKAAAWLLLERPGDHGAVLWGIPEMRAFMSAVQRVSMRSAVGSGDKLTCLGAYNQEA